jgi:hypothetical protein
MRQKERKWSVLTIDTLWRFQLARIASGARRQMMSHLGEFREMVDEQFARALQTLFRERNRLGFSHWIADHTFLVQAIHRSPVVSLPSAVAVVQRHRRNWPDY